MQTDLTKHLLTLQGSMNTRDLGGYATSDGRKTKYRMFYRSDHTASLTEQDIKALESAGVKTVLDLRSKNEVNGQPSKLRHIDGVYYENIPMLDGIHSGLESASQPAMAPPADLGELYISMLDGSMDKINRIFTLFVHGLNHAAMFHCTAGKDRTGVVSMLLLGLAGVPDDTIITDYAETDLHAPPASHVQAQLQKLLNLTVPIHMLQSEPVNMQKTLAHLHKKYGGAHAYLKSCGLDPAALDMLLDAFIA